MDHYKILGLLPEPKGGLSDITELYLAVFKLLPAGKRVYIRTVRQINGWRDLPKTISARIPPQWAERLVKPASALRFPAHPLDGPALAAPYPTLNPLYTPCIPPVYPLYSNRGGIQGV